MHPAPSDVRFALPEALAADGWMLRDETDADTPFLLGLYASTREREIAQMTHWTVAEKKGFLAQQFEAQRHHYRTHIPQCDFWVLAYRGDPIGRLYLETRVTQLHVVDIALVPQWRGKGIGGAILAAVIDAGHRCARNVGLFVDRQNAGALGLYRRLGFVAIGEAGFHIEMKYLVSPDTPSRSDDVPGSVDAIA